MLRWLISKTR